MSASGADIWNAHKERGPGEYVTIAPEDRRRGFGAVGTLVVEKDGGETRIPTRTGPFAASFPPLE